LNNYYSSLLTLFHCNCIYTTESLNISLFVNNYKSPLCPVARFSCDDARLFAMLRVAEREVDYARSVGGTEPTGTNEKGNETVEQRFEGNERGNEGISHDSKGLHARTDGQGSSHTSGARSGITEDQRNERTASNENAEFIRRSRERLQQQKGRIGKSLDKWANDNRDEQSASEPKPIVGESKDTKNPSVREQKDGRELGESRPTNAEHSKGIKFKTGNNDKPNDEQSKRIEPTRERSTGNNEHAIGEQPQKLKRPVEPEHKQDEPTISRQLRRNRSQEQGYDRGR
jgi:hypothetical protein